MFAPEPRTDDGWYVVAGTLESGERVDAFHGGAESFDRPPELAATFPSHRWFVYLLDLPGPGNGPLRQAFAEYLCRRWAADHDTELAAVRVVFVEARVGVDGPPTTEQRDLGQYDCPA
jgi:hypothetical protein